MNNGQTSPGTDGRRAYQKPQVTRVDVVEDEVALASCKRSTSGQRNSSGWMTSGICKTSCMVQAST